MTKGQSQQSGREGEAHAPSWSSALFLRLARGSHSGRPRGILRVWPLWEAFARSLAPVTPIPNAPHGTFGLHFTHYKGEPFDLPDSTRIRPGDAVADIHFNNHAFTVATRDAKWRIVPTFVADMRALAAWMQTPGFPGDVKAIFGVTLLGRGAVRVGFTMRDRPITIKSRLDRFFVAGLMVLYTNEGLERLSKGRTLEDYPQEAWMSRAELLRRYSSREVET